MTLYLLNYNNYYNRIIKTEDTLQDYLRYMLGNALTGTNFNPNDGVNTQHIINWPPMYAIPDYLLVVDEYDHIHSRWFVIEARRTRGGQYSLELRRDLIADFKIPLLDAPMFIEKAKLKATNNLIFNNENMTYNQILKSKTPLTDETEVPWVVGYIPRDSFQQDTKIDFVSYSDANAAADYTVNGIANWSFYQYTVSGGNNLFRARDDLKFVVRFGMQNINSYARDPYANAEVVCEPDVATANISPVSGGLANTLTPTCQVSYAGSANYKSYAEDEISPMTTSLHWDMTIRPAITRYDAAIESKEQTRLLRLIDGKTIKDTSTGDVYDITVDLASTSSYDINLQSDSGITLQNDFTNTVMDSKWNRRTFTNTTFGYRVNNYRVILTQRATNAHTTLNNIRYHLEDAPYDMFCIPAGDITLYKDGVVYTQCQGSLAMAAATAIGEKTGTGNIYDLQILPYCPVRYMLQNGVLDSASYHVHRVFDENDNALTAILWATKSTDKFFVDYNITVPADDLEFKVQNETEFYRLVSPNGNGMFEFKATKNGGVDYFEVDFTYKPFNPFIHVKPNFKRLYGDNPAKDFRGLICGGDFSITQLSNAWANYQQQNVNFQNIFDRQIENMEVINSVQKQQEIISAITGTIGGGIGGATSGALIGGGYGAAIGGALGTLGGAAGGLQDIYYGDRLRGEAVDYTKDQFGYQLGNIQALPTSLAKTGSMVYVNTLFPVLEFYSATPEEVNALRNKIKYNGMTVMVIDTLGTYIQSEPTYIKGKLIRLEGISEDFHLVNAISSELDKGVFI